MSENITLHLRVEGSPLCAVCGVNLDQPVSSWWLSNSWTRDKSYYREGETILPGEHSRSCGSLQIPKIKEEAIR